MFYLSQLQQKLLQTMVQSFIPTNGEMSLRLTMHSLYKQNYHSCRLFKDGYSLSPASLTKIPAGTKLVIPSPNGSSLTLLTGKTPTIAGCLRNSEAVAKFAQKYGSRIAVIPAGEKWENNTLRSAFEDLIGAGAILSYLNGSLSPEAETAVVAFHAFKHDLLTYLKQCSSGKELIAKGFELDVELAAAFNVSDCVPLFTENAYINNNTIHLL